MSTAKALMRAWTDEEFKAQLIADPRSALQEMGVEVIDGVNINVVEDTSDTMYIVLPVAPPVASELSEEE